MTNPTKKAIENTFIQLLNERPLSKISVKDIVERCGVNRNTFYYYYSDLPALTEEILSQSFESAIDSLPEMSVSDDFFEAIIASLKKNKKAILHIYKSENRNLFEKYLMNACERASKAQIKEFAGRLIPTQQDIKPITIVLKCQYFGLIIDWLEKGMEEDASLIYKQYHNTIRKLFDISINDH